MAIRLRRYLKDKLVYWAKDGSAAQGQSKYRQPVEIACRWDDKQTQELMPDMRVVTYESMILVHTDSGIESQGLVYHGTLEEVKNTLKVLFPSVPSTKQGGREIKKVNKFGDFKTRPLLTIVYL